MERYRNESGFINLTSIISPEKWFGRKFNFKYNDKTYYYKCIRDPRNVYNELIAEELASDLNFPHAHYDLAETLDDFGVVSESFLKENERMIYMEDVIYRLAPTYMNEEKNNLDDIWDALLIRYKDEILVYDLMNEVIKIFMFDVLTGNVDRHSSNIGIIEGNDRPRITPIFDNGEMLSSLSTDYGIYALGVRREDYFFSGVDAKLNNHFLEIMLNVGSEIYLEQFEAYLNVISEENILNVLERVSKRIKAPLNENIVIEIIKDFAKNRENINKVLERVRKNKQIKVLKSNK